MKKQKTKSKKSHGKIPTKKVKIAKPIGEVLHYYTKIKVAVVKFKQGMKKGASVRFEGATTNFTQALGSMQLNHVPVGRVAKGKKIGIKVAKRVREGDRIFAGA